MIPSDKDLAYLSSRLTDAEQRRKIAEGYMAVIKAYIYGNQKPEKKLDDIALLLEKYDKRMKG